MYPRWMLRAPLSSSILPLGSEDENHSAFKQLGPAPMTGKCQGHLTTWLSGCQLLFTTLASLLQWRDCVCLFSLLVHFPSNHENKAVLNHVEARNSVLLDLLCGNLCFRFFPPPLLFTRYKRRKQLQKRAHLLAPSTYLNALSNCSVHFCVCRAVFFVFFFYCHCSILCSLFLAVNN